MTNIRPLHASPSYVPATCCPADSQCAFGQDSTKEEPCWGKVGVSCVETTDGDVFVHVCKGHEDRIDWCFGGKYIKEASV